MKTPQRILLLILMSGATAIPAAAPPAGATITDYLMKMQYGLLAPAVAYCKQSSPLTRAELEKEFVAFKGKVTQATEPLQQRIGKNSQPLADAEAAQLEVVIQQGGEKQLVAVKQEDPAVYCPWLQEKLRNSTVESLRTRIENAYARYMASRSQAK